MKFQFRVGEYVTKGGAQAFVDSEREGVLFGSFRHEDGTLRPNRWDKHGNDWHKISDYTLLAPKQKRNVWVNIYESGCAYAVHDSSDNAKAGRGKSGHSGCVACVPVTIEFTPGDGLD